MKLMDLVEHNNTGYPSTATSDQIADMVTKLHHIPEDMEDGDLLFRIHSYKKYHLVWMDPWQIDSGQFYINNSMVDEYVDHLLSGSMFPPIVVAEKDNTIIDGTHRHEAAIVAGVKKIPVYLGLSIDEVPPDENPYNFEME